MTSERLAELRAIVHTAEVKGCMVAASIAREMVDALGSTRTVFLLQNHYEDDAVAGVFASTGAAEAEQLKFKDYDVEAWEVRG